MFNFNYIVNTWIEFYPIVKVNIPLSAALSILQHQQKAADGPVCSFVLRRERKQKRFCDILACVLWGVGAQMF